MFFIQEGKNIFLGKLLVILLATQKSDKTPPCVQWDLPHRSCSKGLYDGIRTYLIYTKFTIAPSSLSARLLMVGVKRRLPLIQWELPVDCNFETVGQGALIGFLLHNQSIWSNSFLGNQNYLVWLCIRTEKREDNERWILAGA